MKKQVNEQALAKHIENEMQAGPDLETVQREAFESTVQQSLPIMWKDGAGKTHLKGTNAIVTATGEDVRQFGKAPGRVCGTCRFFDLEKGRTEMLRQKFPQRMVKDERWSLRYFGVPLSHVGLCGASGGEKATTSISNAGVCDQYRPNTAALRQGGRG